MQVTFDLPKSLAERLQPLRGKLPEMLESAILDWSNTPDPWYGETVAIMKKLMARPTRKEILAIRPSKAMQRRISRLLEKNKEIGLSEEEQQEMERFIYLEEIVQFAKVRAIAPAIGSDSE